MTDRRRINALPALVAAALAALSCAGCGRRPVMLEGPPVASTPTAGNAAGATAQSAKPKGPHYVTGPIKPPQGPFILDPLL